MNGEIHKSKKVSTFNIGDIIQLYYVNYITIQPTTLP